MFANKKTKTEPKHKPKLKSKTRPTSLTKPSSATSTIQQQQQQSPSPVIKDYLSCITLLPTSVFTLIEFIDEGSFGQVFKAKHNQSQTVFAVKILTNISTQLQIQRIILEASILRLCTQCQYINRYYGSYYDYITKDIWLVLEHADYGSISNIYHAYPNVLSQVTEVHIAAIIKMILNALSYLHSHNIIHRDIKAGNFLLNKNGKVQLCDFGTSTLLYQDNSNTAGKIGSPYWMSPEVVSENIYTYACDIWALGITCIELVEGNPPNANIKPLIAMTMIPDKPCKGLTNTKAFSNEFNEFIKKCLIYDYTKRPSSQELMRDEFIMKYKDNVLHKSMMEFIALIEQYKMNKEQFSNIAEDSYIHGDNNITNKNCSIRKALKFTDQSLFNISDTDENNTSVIIHNEEDLTDCAEYLNSAQKPVKPLQFIKCKEKELLDVKHHKNNKNNNESSSSSKLIKGTRNYLIGLNNIPKCLNDSIEQSTTQIMNNNPYSSKKNSTRRKSMFIQSIEYITNKKNKQSKQQQQCLYPQMKLSNRNMLSLNNTKDEDKQESTSHKTNNKHATVKHHKIYSVSPGVSYITLNKQKTN